MSKNRIPLRLGMPHKQALKAAKRLGCEILHDGDNIAVVHPVQGRQSARSAWPNAPADPSLVRFLQRIK